MNTKYIALTKEQILNYKKGGMYYWHCYQCNSVCNIEDSRYDQEKWVKTKLSSSAVFKKYGNMSSCICPRCRDKKDHKLS